MTSRNEGELNACGKVIKRQIYVFPQGIGDGIMATAIAACYFAQTGHKMLLAHKQASLFENNPYVECHSEYAVQNLTEQAIRQADENGDQLIAISYLVFQDASDKVPMRSAPEKSMLCRMAERVGLSGRFEALPRIFLTQEEALFGKMFDVPPIAVFSQGIERYKTWDKHKMEEVIAAIPERAFIQLGATGDEEIKGAKYLCGKLSLRQTSAVLSNSRCLIGPQGALIHLARAVDCPAIILGPSAEPYPEMAYPEYRTVAPENACPHCTKGGMFFANCECQERCMEGISAESVIEALREELSSPRRVKPATIYQITPDPANDLLDFHRQYDHDKRLTAILRTRTGTELHSIFMTLKTDSTENATAIVQFNRECQFVSLNVSNTGTLAFKPYMATVWQDNIERCTLPAEEIMIHGCLKMDCGGEIWHIARKPLVCISFSRVLNLHDGDKLILHLRAKDIQDCAKSSHSAICRIMIKLKLPAILSRLSKIYDNRWTRRLWGAGY